MGISKRIAISTQKELLNYASLKNHIITIFAGVSQLCVAINKMDTVEWDKQRYDEITKKLGGFLKTAGFRESDVAFIPCSGLSGENLTVPPTEEKLASWYSGPTLVQQIGKILG